MTRKGYFNLAIPRENGGLGCNIPRHLTKLTLKQCKLAHHLGLLREQGRECGISLGTEEEKIHPVRRSNKNNIIYIPFGPDQRAVKAAPKDEPVHIGSLDYVSSESELKLNHPPTSVVRASLKGPPASKNDVLAFLKRKAIVDEMAYYNERQRRLALSLLDAEDPGYLSDGVEEF